MKAIRVHEFGGPEVLKLEDVSDLQAAAGQVVVRVKAAGVNPFDTYMRQGTYAIKPPLPYTPGSDAAGLVDPITGEGLYYAIRSGDLASRAILDGTVQSYSDLLRRDFGAELEFAASIAKRMFLGRFLFDSIPARMIDFVRRSQCYRNVVQDLFAGTQSYLGLKRRLVESIGSTMWEVAMSRSRIAA